eukprot:11002875-Heterocapsa_arctica.AAC.1
MEQFRRLRNFLDPSPNNIGGKKKVRVQPRFGRDDCEGGFWRVPCSCSPGDGEHAPVLQVLDGFSRDPSDVGSPLGC